MLRSRSLADIDGRNDHLNLVRFENRGEGIDVAIIHGKDTSADFLLLGLRGLQQVTVMTGYAISLEHGSRTSRAKTTVVCFPSETKASTMARPSLPVPPATAITDMLAGLARMNVCEVVNDGNSLSLSLSKPCLQPWTAACFL